MAAGPAGSSDRSADEVAMVAEHLGAVLDDSDLAWTAGALVEQKAVSAEIDGLDLNEVDPLVTFDARWHD
ncbi:MAG: hypothetical protein JWR35_2265 [Marmoricola sp.]|nr:hypothetical protein [Marmoricola sp.]